MTLSGEAAPLTIRTMMPAEVDLAVGWAAAEGWNPGDSDASVFRSTDPDGFLVALQDDEPVAVLSVVAYGAAFGFLGLYIVRPDRRGEGIGHALWSAGMARLGDRTVGLDGVVGQQANYRKSGFAYAHRNVRYNGVPGMVAPTGRRVRPWRGEQFDDIATFDAQCFPAERQAFLRGWLSAPGHRTFMAEQDGRIVGYGVVRPCRQGSKIGPLFAADPSIAAELCAALVGAVPPGTEISIDVPEPNTAAVEMVQAMGMAPVFETARMYRGGISDLSPRVFGITTFELG